MLLTSARLGLDGDEDAGWSILGSPETWQAVLGGQVNLHVALRHCELRYCSTGEDGPLATQTRVAMLADLLGLGSWPQAGTASQAMGATAAAEDAAVAMAAAVR